ncbi:MAG: alpha-amylase [Cytophagaceae bacterium]|nr:alpha-amylase [Gemmatimonadaceae bacterium]
MLSCFRHTWALLAVTALIAAALPAQARRDVAQEQARTAPAWARDGLIYELNTRTFSATGNFAGVTARLGELKALGVSIVWLMPIHPLGQVKKKGTVGSPYAVQDYYGINPAYGTKEDFKRLVAEAHRQGLKVIMDIVANHTSWDNVMMRTPAYYRRDASGNVVSPYDWTDVAALDYSNPALRKYITDMLVHWVREYDVDGFRCDVAGEVPLDFWEQARTSLEQVKRDIFLLAEAERPNLLVRAFDADYGWAMYHAMTDVITRGRSARAVRETWEQERRTYPRGALHMRIADDHDEKRALALFGERGAMAATALIFTLDGIPLLYNGQEAGDATESRAPALFEALPVSWGSREIHPDVPRFHRGVIGLRAAHVALRQGSTTWLGNSDEERIVTFLRGDGTEQVLVAINLSSRPFAGTVEASGDWTEVTPGADAARAPGLPALSLEAWGFRAFRKPQSH